MCCAQVGCPRPADAWPLTTMLMVGYMAMQRWMWLSRRCVARWRSWFLDRANLSSSDTQPRSLHRHIPSSSDSNMPMHAVQMFEWRSFKAPFQISFIFFYLRLLPLGLNLWLCCCDQKMICKKEFSCLVRCRYCQPFQTASLALKVERQCGWPNCGRLQCMWLLGEDAFAIFRPELFCLTVFSCSLHFHPPFLPLPVPYTTGGCLIVAQNSVTAKLNDFGLSSASDNIMQYLATHLNRFKAVQRTLPWKS